MILAMATPVANASDVYYRSMTPTFDELGAIIPAGWVKGYTRKDGTYVKGHRRTNPNSTKLDNIGCTRDGDCF